MPDFSGFSNITPQEVIWDGILLVNLPGVHVGDAKKSIKNCNFCLYAKVNNNTAGDDNLA